MQHPQLDPVLELTPQLPASHVVGTPRLLLAGPVHDLRALENLESRQAIPVVREWLPIMPNVCVRRGASRR